MNRIETDLDAAAYHADLTTISKHGLDLINRAPALYAWKKSGEAEEETSPALRWGTLVHLAVLEPHKLRDEVAVAPEGIDRRTKAGKEAWAEFEASAAGKITCTVEEVRKLREIFDAVRSHPAANALLTGDLGIEHSVYWTDPETGIACRARPDVIRCDGLVIDLKTCQSAERNAFSRASANYRYNVQAAFYLDGLRANGVEADAFVFIAVEKEAPFLVQCLAADDSFVSSGRAAYRRDLETYQRCLTSGDWPGYSDAVEPLALPAWADRD